MKANQVKPEVNTIPGQDCCECEKPLKAPWARVDGGKKWVCSKGCYDLYQYKIPHLAAYLRKLTAS